MNWYILAVIPVFSLLVFVHELGHFLTAKWAGIRVEEFGLGFPPNVVSVRKRASGGWEVMWFGRSREIDTSSTQNPFSGTSGGISGGSAAVPQHTMYSLNLLPIGGFVRMPGENGDALDENGNYDEQSFAAKSAGKRIAVLCAGVAMNFLLGIVLFTIAYSVGRPVGTNEPVLGTVQPGSPAQAAGLHSDDRILSVNGQPVKSFNQMRDIVASAIKADPSQNATVPVTLVLRHSNSTAQVTTVVNARKHPAPDAGAMGVSGQVILVKSPIWEAPIKGIQQTFDFIRTYLGLIGQMIIGAVQPQFSGPVGIARVTSDVAQTVPYYGWWPILSLAAILSLNLAIFNILPFPALDGGRVFLVLIEILRGGKRLKPEREGLINFIGLAVLLLLMVVVTVSDVLHLGS
ncbi:MAG: RIP metalloprotease RseP [Ktedonobacteraceae bacterium]